PSPPPTAPGPGPSPSPSCSFGFCPPSPSPSPTPPNPSPSPTPDPSCSFGQFCGGSPPPGAGRPRGGGGPPAPPAAAPGAPPLAVPGLSGRRLRARLVPETRPGPLPCGSAVQAAGQPGDVGFRVGGLADHRRARSPEHAEDQLRVDGAGLQARVPV